MNPEQPERTEAELEAADAAEAPDIAEALADRLEAELEQITKPADGEG